MRTQKLNIIVPFLLGFFALTFAAVWVGTTLVRDTATRSDGHVVPVALAERFAYLEASGNSSCSAAFRDSISTLPEGDRLRGSCCSPMSLHRYTEQVEGLKKFKYVAGQNIPEIPDDPYDIDAGLARRLMFYYDMALSAEEQAAYNYAMENSNEKGPCCCKCWRWYVYGGLGKFLIREHGLSGAQVTEVWNLSDGCGGEGDHVTH